MTALEPASTWTFPEEAMTERHLTKDRCYYCATDSEMSAAVGGSGWHPTIHMDLPVTACPKLLAEAPEDQPWRAVVVEVPATSTAAVDGPA